MTPMSCPFCEPLQVEIVTRYDSVFVVSDGFPVSPGHTLIIPVRHVQSFFELDAEEHCAMFEALKAVQEKLAASLSPDGFNVGINDGSAAGQTIPHCHLHVIPRYAGDVADPRGGIRWVVPDKAVYW